LEGLDWREQRGAYPEVAATFLAGCRLPAESKFRAMPELARASNAAKAETSLFAVVSASLANTNPQEMPNE